MRFPEVPFSEEKLYSVFRLVKHNEGSEAVSCERTIAPPIPQLRRNETRRKIAGSQKASLFSSYFLLSRVVTFGQKMAKHDLESSGEIYPLRANSEETTDRELSKWLLLVEFSCS